MIFLVLIAGVAAIMLAIAIGIVRRDLIVEDHPYEAGLEFDNRLKKYAELGWKLERLDIKDNKLIVRLIDRDRRPLEKASVEAVVNKCADIKRRYYGCSYRDEGYYQCPVDIKNINCIEVKVNVLANNDTMIFERKLIMGQY
ncbi:MAG: FixH family protein [Thermodesulfovibrionales bacterium]